MVRHSRPVCFPKVNLSRFLVSCKFVSTIVLSVSIFLPKFCVSSFLYVFFVISVIFLVLFSGYILIMKVSLLFYGMGILVL